jgi:hypothetical protein
MEHMRSAYSKSILPELPQGKNQLGELDVDGKMVLNWISEK